MKDIENLRKLINGKWPREYVNQDTDIYLFWEFHNRNPHLFSLYRDHVFYRLKRGVKKTSSSLILELLRGGYVIRDDSIEMLLPCGTTGDFIITIGGDRKQIHFPNAYKPWYARLFIAVYPQYEDHFETVERKKCREN